MPGVVGHCTDFIEHPDLVAERLVRYARLVGRENVLAGTDCGLGARVGHPSICWAKFEALAEGARRATKQLWGPHLARRTDPPAHRGVSQAKQHGGGRCAGWGSSRRR
jgi:hypothetical protein